MGIELQGAIRIVVSHRTTSRWQGANLHACHGLMDVDWSVWMHEELDHFPLPTKYEEMELRVQVSEV